MPQPKQTEQGNGLGCLALSLLSLLGLALEILALCLGSAWMLKRFFL